MRSKEDYISQKDENPNHSQQPSKLAKHGEDGCTESLDSDRKINLGFEESGTSSKKSSADTRKGCGNYKRVKNKKGEQVMATCGMFYCGDRYYCDDCSENTRETSSK